MGDRTVSLEERLRQMHPQLPSVVMVETPVPGVPGASVIRGALTQVTSAASCAPTIDAVLTDGFTKAETAALCSAVRELHASAADVDTEQNPRRASQHHVPCTVPTDSIGGLCSRLRHVLPSLAGPGNCAPLASPGHEISTFLRCYRYTQGDISGPHFDRSFTKHACDDTSGRKGRMVSFSGYSLLLYLSDDYLGGETSFFGQDDALQMSKRKLTPVADHELKYVARVRGQAGDILIFPHGSHAGCHPNPLHEGSTVTEGEKILMRTDIVFRPQPKNTRQRRRPATEDSAFPPKSTARSRQASDLDLQAAEACIRTALAHVCPRFIDVATGSVSRIADAKAAEFSCNAATRVYWAARRLGQAQASPQSPGASKDAPRASSPPLPRTVGESRVDTVVVVSDFGVARSFDRVGLAERVVAAIPQDDTSATFAFLNVADGVAGTIIMTSRARAAAKAEGGLAPCSLCGRFVSVDTMGVEWHMKTVHRITAHAEAYEAAAAAQRAIVQYRSREETVHGSDDFVRGGPPRKLQISDMTEAQASPAAAARLVREGRVRSLGSGLEACRCGDVDELRRVVEEEGWCAAESRDRHGSGALLWAAGGGHLACCRYLVESCKVSATDSQAGRRGYDGRSALHWAARNGHLDVVRWLVKVCGCNGDAQSTDGTTPFSLAVWQGHLDVCGFLVECGADAHRFNSYGCNAAMWAAQGPGGSVTVFEYLRRLDVDVDRINDNGQGCLHKAAQRGNREICNWLLKVAQIRSAHHFQPNLIEKSIPSELARFAGDDVLAKTLESWEQRLGTSSADL